MKRALIAVMLIALAAGCGQSSTPAGAPGAGGEAGAADDGAPKYTIAVIPKGLAHQFWLTVKAGAEAAGEEFDAEIIWQGPNKETEIDKQISIIEDMITKQVDALVMAACDEHALIDVLEVAQDAGITVVTIDSGVESELPISFVATDNIAGAKAAADKLAELIGGEGQVGLIPFVKGAATSEWREEGFKEGIKAHPKITLVSTQYCQSDPAKAMSITEDMMTSQPELKGIFAANEAAAIGCAQAIAAAGKTGAIKLVSFDASDQQIADLKNGTCQALVVQNPFKMGYEGVKAAIDHMEGREVEKRIDTGVTVVTMDNFDDPEVQKVLYPLE